MELYSYQLDFDDGFCVSNKTQYEVFVMFAAIDDGIMEDYVHYLISDRTIKFLIFYLWILMCSDNYI